VDVIDVTVSLPADLARRARDAALDRGMSLSAFVAAVLEQTVNGQLTYDEVRGRVVKRVAEGPILEADELAWTRADLHDRRL
jgi:hypothetical protein